MAYFEGQPKGYHWRSSAGPVAVGQGTTNGNFHVAPMDPDGGQFPFAVVASSFALAVSFNLTATSVSQQLSSTMRLGLFTRNASTLSLINSASLTFGNTNASTANTSRWNGIRFLQLTTGNWSSTPIFLPGVNYYIAVQFISHVTTGAASLMVAASISTGYSGLQGGPTVATSHQPFGPFRGIFTVTTTAVPATIQASQISGTGALMNVSPWMRIDENYGIY